MTERRKNHLIGAGLGLAYVLVLLLTAPDLAMSRDESFYAHAAKRYSAWVERLVNDPESALEQKSIARAWGYNWEHPPLMKLAFGASVRLNDALGVFSRDSLAFRFPGMLTAGLLLWLIYVWGMA